MSYKIIGKYIKELNFNIPNPKTFFLLSKDIVNYKINIDIKSTQVKQNIIEILTTLALNPIKENFEKIGKFDENFFLYFEETEYCYRAKKNGYIAYQINDIKAKSIGRSVETNNNEEKKLNNILIWHFIA